MILDSMEWSDRPSPNRHLGHSLEKRDPNRHEDATAEKAVPFSVPLFDIKPFIAWQRRHGVGWKMQERRSNILGRRRALDDQGRFEMSEFSDSYILRVLLAPHTPTRAIDTVARRWRWLRASVCDPYRPELHYMRWARTKMAREARARRWVVEQGALATRQIRRSAKCAGKH